MKLDDGLFIERIVCCVFVKSEVLGNIIDFQPNKINGNIIFPPDPPPPPAHPTITHYSSE